MVVSNLDMAPSRLHFNSVFLILISLLTGVAGAIPKESTISSITHHPPAPRPGEAVTVSALAAPGAGPLILHYQVVDPGRYIELKDPAFWTSWVTLPMRPGKPTPGGTSYTVELPGALQTNRRLVRYRIATRTTAGETWIVPAKEESVPNFAYFTYAGVPAWRGAINPQSGEARWSASVTYSEEVMRRVQSCHLLGKAQSIENATWSGQDWGRDYKFTGTLVADGVVYDHIRYRARGGGWRYAMGKNMWKFAFNKNQPLRVRDDYGQASPVAWDKVNLRACIQQGDYGHRGEQGLFEAAGFRLFNLAGAAAPHTHWIQLRIVTGAEEAPASQYQGDFWGLYLAMEEVDGRFLKRHGLGDGNVYKMEGGSGTAGHVASGSVTNRSDLDHFLQSYQERNPAEAWWRTNLDLAAYYNYRAIVECIHHYDISDGKNYYYYRQPGGRWQVIPWDIDLTWADNMYGGGDEPFQSRVLAQPALRLAYQNRLREIRDLLYNPEATGRLLDECAAIIADPAGGPSPVDADRAKWDFHPIMEMGGKAGTGLFYQAASSRDFRGMVQLMKNYVRSRGAWIDSALLNDPQIPATPALAYAGPPGYPAAKLSFRASAYRGASAFAAEQWRLAEMAPPTLRRGSPLAGGGPFSAPGKYEITPVWESGELARPAAEMTIPAPAVAPGRVYRVRVRVRDTTGRWSHWSAPVEFTAGKP